MNSANRGGVVALRNDNLQVILHMNDMNGVDCGFNPCGLRAGQAEGVDACDPHAALEGRATGEGAAVFGIEVRCDV